MYRITSLQGRLPRKSFAGTAKKSEVWESMPRNSRSWPTKIWPSWKCIWKPDIHQRKELKAAASVRDTRVYNATWWGHRTVGIARLDLFLHANSDAVKRAPIMLLRLFIALWKSGHVTLLIVTIPISALRHVARDCWPLLVECLSLFAFAFH